MPNHQILAGYAPAWVTLVPSLASRASTSSLITFIRSSSFHTSPLNDLVLEGRAIQQRLSNKQPRSNCSDPDGRLAYSFAKLMFNGKTKHALDILS